MKKIDNSKYLWVSLRMTTKADGTTEFDKFIQVRKDIDQKINNFLATEEGKNVVNNIHRFTIEDLIYKYNLKYLLKMHCNKQAIIDYVRDKIRKIPNNIIDYTHTNNRTPIKCKMYQNLSKKELKNIWKNKPSNKLQYAERMNALEQHKIDKWEKENKPSFEQLKADLFPKSIIEAFTDKMQKKREQIREDLSKLYPDPIYRPIYVRYYSTPDIIKEKLIGYVKDIKQIINDRPCFYTLENISKDLYDQLMNLRIRMKNIFGDDLICLKAITRTNTVGCWIQGCG